MTDIELGFEGEGWPGPAPEAKPYPETFHQANIRDRINRCSGVGFNDEFVDIDDGIDDFANPVDPEYDRLFKEFLDAYRAEYPLYFSVPAALLEGIPIEDKYQLPSYLEEARGSMPDFSVESLKAVIERFLEEQNK